MAEPSPRLTKSDIVRRHLQTVIDGGLQPHDKLPTERELAEEFDFSRLTVRRALDQLEQEGVVYRVQGAGTFVGVQHIAKSFELASFSEDMRARGLVPGSRTVVAETVPAPARVAHALHLSPGTPVVHIYRVRTADGAPMCVENVYLPADLVPDLDVATLEGSLYEVLDATYNLRPERADQVIRATVLEPADGDALEVPHFSPGFEVTRTAYDVRERAVEYAESLYRGDRFSYELSIRRTSAAGPR